MNQSNFQNEKGKASSQGIHLTAAVASGWGVVPSVDPLDSLHVSARGPDHFQESPHDTEAEGNGQKRDFF